MTAALALALLLAGPNLVVNGDFETLQDGWPAGWSRGWSRDGAAAFRCELSTEARGGQHAVRFVHTGAQDWSLQPPALVVKEGDLLELSCWVKQPGEGEVVLCATLAPAQGEQGIQWAAGT
ncbi:MAG: hypothetical protein HUU35_19165, partial [Armatimonadetes bacterium]|nr:hypothetical protein [Armatimonadota bacterium]